MPTAWRGHDRSAHRSSLLVHRLPRRVPCPGLAWACDLPVAFKVLHRTFVLLRCSQRAKRAKVAPLPGLWILLARVQPVLAGAQFANHDRSSSLFFEKPKQQEATGVPGLGSLNTAADINPNFRRVPCPRL